VNRIARLAGTRTGLLIGLALIIIASQFFRSSLAVIAPELADELSLTPQVLGLAGGMFFLAIGVSQVPVGMSFDRIGPRRTVVWVSVFAIIGTVMMALANSGPTLIAARFLTGFGCGASFMSSVVLITRWYPPERIGTMLGRMFALSQLGNVLAATPMAWMSEHIGWRVVFGATGVILIFGVWLFWVMVRDLPADQAPIHSRAPTLGQTLAGFIEVLRLPGYRKVVALHMVAYATMATLLGLWAGPYLHDVHGLDGVARGNVLLAMTAAQTIGMLWLPPLERRLNTRKGVIMAAAAIVVLILVVMAILPGASLVLSIGLLVALCGFSSYSPLIIAHAAGLTPPALLGRGSATANLGQVAGSFLLPVIAGLIAGAFDDGSVPGHPVEAYQAIFIFLAVALSAGLLIYSRVSDLKPVPKS
jgi:MFS family permease